MLKHDPEQRQRRGAGPGLKHIVTTHSDGRASRHSLARKARYQKALPAPVAPEDHDNFPGIHLKIKTPIVRSIPNDGKVADGKWRRLNQEKVR